jgi:hypothetical protein
MQVTKRSLSTRARKALGVESLEQGLAGIRAELQHLGRGGPDQTASKVSQLILANQYREMIARGVALPALRDAEFRGFSQNGEDGILLYLFSILGMGQRRCVEICAGTGIQCNTANLIINHGWHGLLVEGDSALVEQGRCFYRSHMDTFVNPPRFVTAWITRENVNTVIRENGFEGEIDLLSLDLDGVDYWIWEAIDVVRPRVVIAEIQCLWGADRSVTVPYAPDFKAQFIEGLGIYAGASLPAFTKLARRKGYRLIGVQALGFNAVFVRDAIGEDVFPGIEPESCAELPFVDWARRTLLPKVKDLDWVEV